MFYVRNIEMEGTKPGFNFYSKESNMIGVKIDIMRKIFFSVFYSKSTKKIRWYYVYLSKKTNNDGWKDEWL